jgi:hypothetical protein
LGAYSEGESFKQFIYFQKFSYVFIMHGIIIKTRDLFFSRQIMVDVSGAHADGERLRQFRSSTKTMPVPALDFRLFFGRYTFLLPFG